VTEKYSAYLQLLATRDQALISLAALAFCVVLAWELRSLWPVSWRAPVSKLYLIGGLALYFATLVIVALIGANPNG
jgi:hypothetical protein